MPSHELLRRKATTPPENLLRKIMGYDTQLQFEIQVNHLFSVEVADLCVYTNKCIHIVEDIKYDKDYVEKLLGKSFFHSYVL